MPLMLVPHEVGQDRVQLWIGALNETTVNPASLSVMVRSGTGPAASASVGAWQGSVGGRGRTIHYARLTIQGLQPRTRYRCELLRDGAVVAEATAFAATLPLDIPTIEETERSMLRVSTTSVCPTATTARIAAPVEMRLKVRAL